MLVYKPHPNEELATNQVEDSAIASNPEILPEIQIIDNIFQALDQSAYIEANNYILELHNYIVECPINMQCLNEKNINLIFSDLFDRPEMAGFFDNIISCLYLLVSNPNYNIDPFGSEPFFQHILINILPTLANPENAFKVLGILLIRTQTPANVLISPVSLGILSKSAQDSDESITNSLLFLFAIGLRYFDQLPEEYSSLFLPFVQQHLDQQLKNMNLTYCICVISNLERILPEKIFRFLLKHVDANEFYQHDFTSLLTDNQISLLQILLILFENYNKTAINQFNLEYISSLFLNKRFDSNHESDSCLLLNFFNLIRKYFIMVFKSPSSFHKLPEIIQSDDFIHSLFDFSMKVIDDFPFNVKESAFTFLSDFSLMYPHVIPELLDMGHISVLAHYLNAPSVPLLYSIIRSFVYLIQFGLNNQLAGQRIFQSMEEEEILQKIDELEVNDPDYVSEFKDAKLKDFILEFTVLYYQLGNSFLSTS